MKESEIEIWHIFTMRLWEHNFFEPTFLRDFLWSVFRLEYALGNLLKMGLLTLKLIGDLKGISKGSNVDQGQPMET